ncbi:MAG: leucine--tRNA ligase, partial [Candidatus Harrisonbacteria bacterium]|nr:leucine--tRNA ligase [Candidatus Harrisonbacteria bacterium]
IEKKWQSVWAKSGYKLWRAKDEGKAAFAPRGGASASRGKKYVLDMFPYPSGEGLHVGHLLGYVGSDILSRYYRMRGFNVLHPMGWDAFGLPAENYALKHKIHPAVAVKKNIKNFKRQLNAPGFSYDWSREINTTDPDYYKWTQWIFLQMFKRGLAYEANIPVNWCPQDKTVITAYADRLLKDLDTLDWPEKVKELQRNWIGRSEGALIKFPVVILRATPEESRREILRSAQDDAVEVFTTRPDTLAGATYVVLAPEHELIANRKSQIANWKEVETYVSWAKNRSDRERQENKEKTGVELTGIKAMNPLNNEELPVWVADYVLGSYGTGAIMAVPAHDERDRAFAEKFKLPIIDRPLIPKDEVVQKVGGKKTINYKLRDWIFSRQRYWGEPIPVIHCLDCGTVAVPEKDLPVKLPNVKSYKPTGTGESPLANIKKWVEVKCPQCGKNARRETNTMPQWAGSCWYYIAYVVGKNSKFQIPNSKKTDYWLPVDLYIGGVEHAVLHLLYARFWHKFLYDIGVVRTIEPFQKLMNQGLMMGTDGAKMSKSKGNVINPDEMIEKFGADALRMYEMFMGPFEDAKAWDPNGIVGIVRFLNRFWNFVIANKRTAETNEKALYPVHRTIKKVTEDIEKFRFNTAISAFMVLLNEVETLAVAKVDLVRIVKAVAPFAPHIAQELYAELGNKKLLDNESWPEWNAALAEEEIFDLVVQINGRTRGKVKAVKGIGEHEAKELALDDADVKRWVTGDVKKVIFVKDRLINDVKKVIFVKDRLINLIIG